MYRMVAQTYEKEHTDEAIFIKDIYDEIERFANKGKFESKFPNSDSTIISYKDYPYDYILNLVDKAIKVLENDGFVVNKKPKSGCGALQYLIIKW